MKKNIELPSTLHFILDQAMEFVKVHKEHHLLPSIRLAIYEELIKTISRSPGPNRILGELGILNSEYVLPIWQSVSPIWNHQAILEEAKKQLSPEELKEYQDNYILGDNNVLPQRWISIGKNVLSGKMDPEIASREVHNLWDVTPGIASEFQDRDELIVTPYFISKAPYDLLQRAYYACETAFKALQEIVGRNLLSEVKNIDQYSDDNLYMAHRDSASSAVIAYAGSEDVAVVDIGKRYELWKWWLNQAIPTAFKRASR